MECYGRAAIATRNRGKYWAAVRALERLCGISRDNVAIVEPPNGLPAQPIGGLEVFRGALLRAARAFEAVAPSGLGIGVEAGPVEFYTGTGYIETQVAVVVGPGRRYSVGTSSSFELPALLLDKMKKGIELGKLIESRRHVRNLRESIGYIGVATSGLVTRTDLTLHAIAMALVPWYSGYTESLARLEDVDNI
ncbi:MAG: DUF84 family protein [Desulfurococcales archaeon]|nr:DUF84 family protein [Desulfurococcales archaeon]